MFGNCATGRLAMVTAPTITMRMAMTIATMGRLMKKLDMDIGSFRSNSESSALASSERAAREGSPGYAGPPNNTHVASVPPPLFAFIGAQMVWVARSCLGGESAGPGRRHVHQASVRLGQSTWCQCVPQL